MTKKDRLHRYRPGDPLPHYSGRSRGCRFWLITYALMIISAVAIITGSAIAYLAQGWTGAAWAALLGLVLGVCVLVIRSQ